MFDYFDISLPDPERVKQKTQQQFFLCRFNIKLRNNFSINENY